MNNRLKLDEQLIQNFQFESDDCHKNCNYEQKPLANWRRQLLKRSNSQTSTLRTRPRRRIPQCIEFLKWSVLGIRWRPPRPPVRSGRKPEGADRNKAPPAGTRDTYPTTYLHKLQKAKSHSRIGPYRFNYALVSRNQ